MTNLGLLLFERGDPSGEDWLRRAAEAGQADAMCLLGVLLDGRGARADAEDWFRKALVSGNPKAAAIASENLTRLGKLPDGQLPRRGSP